jgi:hypothetical protein
MGNVTDTSHIANERSKPYRATNRGRIMQALIREGYTVGSEVNKYIIAKCGIANYPEFVKTDDDSHKRIGEIRCKGGMLESGEIYFLHLIGNKSVAGKQEVQHYRIATTPDPIALCPTIAPDASGLVAAIAQYSHTKRNGTPAQIKTAYAAMCAAAGVTGAADEAAPKTRNQPHKGVQMQVEKVFFKKQ